MIMSELKTYNVDGGLILNVGDYDVAVFNLWLECPAPEIRIFSFQGFLCQIEYPTSSTKNVFLTIQPETQAQGKITFLKGDMNHVLIFQSLMDFLTSWGREDRQALFKLYVTGEGYPVRYEPLNCLKVYPQK